MTRCDHCGNLLTGVQRRFCSILCRNRYHYAHRHERQSTSQKHRRIRRSDCEVCQGPLSGRQTRFCSTECKNVFHQAYPHQKQRGLRRKIELVQRLGGKCMKCGYANNLAALSFHHEEEDQKNHQLDMRSLSNRRIEAVMREFEKCILLCANCHMETHYPDLDMSKLDIDVI